MQILFYVVQAEREFIYQRQADVIAYAKARVGNFGRERRKLPDSLNDAFEQYSSGRLTIRAAADLCGMSYGIFYRRIKDFSRFYVDFS